MVVLGTGLVVYCGPGGAASSHRHDAIQLIWSPNRPFRLVTESGALEAHAAVVPANAPHRFEAGDELLVMVFVEPAGELGRWLGVFATEHDGLDIDAWFADVDLTSPGDADDAIRWGQDAAARLAGVEAVTTGSGVRPEVLAAVDFIEANLDGTPRLEDAARTAALSPRQLRRSFAAEIGIPFRRYVLWRRMRRAFIAVRKGADMTTAAAMAGFADAAHFSRTFRKMFGLAPSDVLPILTITDSDEPTI